MNHWPFIIAAYAVAGVGTLALLAWSWIAMRRVEAETDRIGRDR